MAGGARMTTPRPSRALALPARQVTALCKGAAKAGCIAEVRIGDVVVRLVPEHHAQKVLEQDEEIEL